VARYTAFGTPQHGNPKGCFLVPDQCLSSPILQRLNRGDDTPGRIHYTSIASRQTHAEEANGMWHPLDYGVCLPLIDGGPHATEPRNAVIYEAVKDGLNFICPRVANRPTRDQAVARSAFPARIPDGPRALLRLLSA
jgi:hypothetical protein